MTTADGPSAANLPVAAQYALLVVAALLSGFGDIAIFQWAKGQSPWGLAGGLALWVVSLVLAGYLFRYSPLPFSVLVVLMVVIHLLIDVAWDVAVFGSRLTFAQWAGLALAGAALLLLEFGKKTPESAL